MLLMLALVRVYGRCKIIFWTLFFRWLTVPSYSDFADEFPNCRVVGTDISPIQPSWVPPNLSFNIDDATKEWAFQPDLFDYIHIRWLCGTIKDWPSLYKEAYRCTKPGGWIEHVDGDVNVVCLDGTMPDDSAMNQWGKIWTSVERKTGNVFNIVRTGIMEDGLKEAGFTNVQIEDYLVSFIPIRRSCKVETAGRKRRWSVRTTGQTSRTIYRNKKKVEVLQSRIQACRANSSVNNV